MGFEVEFVADFGLNLIQKRDLARNGLLRLNFVEFHNDKIL